MNKRLLVLGVITFIILLSGCGQEITCNKPYILVGTSCCLDQNNNSICDTHEKEDKDTVTEKLLPGYNPSIPLIKDKPTGKV